MLSYLVKMIYKIHERIVGRNMRDERTIKLLAANEISNYESKFTSFQILPYFLRRYYGYHIWHSRY